MRIGSIVSVNRMTGEGQWIAPKDAPEGNVIAIEHDEDCDGYDRIESLTIRWSDGRVETRETTGEDEIGDWELVETTPELYANLYLYDRAYGGSEEGGWWYDVYTPADNDWNEEPPPHGLMPSVQEAKQAIEALDEWCKRENRSRRSPSSMASDGHFVTRLEAWPASPTPTQRPHYC